jgi:hypothetical protein
MTTITNGRLGALDHEIAGLRAQGDTLRDRLAALNEKLNADTRRRRDSGREGPPPKELGERDRLHVEAVRVAERINQLQQERYATTAAVRPYVARALVLERILGSLAEHRDLYERCRQDGGALLNVLRASPDLQHQAVRFQQGWAVLGEIDRLQAELDELRAKIARLGVPDATP